MRLGAALLVPLLLSSCTYLKLLNQQPELSFNESTRTFSFVGPITFGSAEQLRTRVPAGSALVFQSTGGRSEEALAISEWLRDSRIDLTLRGYCVSACANYIAGTPGAKWSEPLLIAFHGGGLGRYVRPCTESGCPDPVSDNEKTAILAYQKLGLNINFVTFSGRATDDLEARRGPLDGVTRLPFLPSNYFWVPTREELRCFGLDAPVTPLERVPLSETGRKFFQPTTALSPALQLEFKQLCPLAAGPAAPHG